MARRIVGTVVAIPLGDQGFGYARLLPSPLVEFFDVQTSNVTLPTDLETVPIAFRLLVMQRPITTAAWNRVGSLSEADRAWPAASFSKRDVISGETSVYEFAANGDTATRALREDDDLSQLERYAVWSQGHVEDRLKDHFAGRPNRWVESLRLT